MNLNNKKAQLVMIILIIAGLIYLYLRTTGKV